MRHTWLKVFSLFLKLFPGALISFALILAVLLWAVFHLLRSEPMAAKITQKQSSYINSAMAKDAEPEKTLYDRIVEKVLPLNGFQSKIALNDSVIKLVKYEVIDAEKFEALYKRRGGLPEGLKSVLKTSSSKPILLTRENANVYVNLLWPLGLANYMSTNKESPINGKSLFNFASTGGWALGKESNGGAYFNKLRIIELSPEQEELVTKIAKNTFRPCCNNSTFYQDCNHGSALMGLLQLGVAQGLSEEELYREALAFNSFWFPNNYVHMALYFEAGKKIDWEKVDPKIAMSKDFSSGRGWYINVEEKIEALGLLPKQQGGAGCGV